MRLPRIRAVWPMRQVQRRTCPADRDPSPVSYAPVDDSRADPGEVVWAWVPFEEDATRGKDRPVLVIGRRGDQLLALPLTSKDHDRDAAQEAGAGRHWMDVGAGDWDARRRPSEVRLDRLVRLRDTDIRRVGSALPEDVFDRVVAAAGDFHTI